MKIFLKITLLSVLVASATSLPALCKQDEISDINTKIQSVGFKKAYEANPKRELTSFFNNHTKYTNCHKLEELQNLYAADYTNADGFDKATYFEMVKKTWNLYPEVKYLTLTEDIHINGEYAVVQAKEYAIGKTKNVFENIKGSGLVQSESSTLYYLQKIGNNWKITSNSIIYEKTTLKYGDARWLNMSLDAPTVIRAGQEYTAKLKIDTPSGVFVLASITNEPIIFPQAAPKEVFRTVKKDGELERIFTANKDNLNEYSVASIGITKASISNPTSININITGMAFIMTRINTLSDTTSKIAKISEAKKENDAKN